ncbi:MAG: M28 family peptidase, partial [Saprospiraceae bacterium]
MKTRNFFLASFICLSQFLFAQTNMGFTNPEILNVLQGNYDPQVYMPAEIISDPYVISAGMLDEINPDSLKATLFALRTFENRNTGSDTISATRGIGAARTWVLKKFNEYSVASENRLVTGYFQFDLSVCNMGRHKNVVAVLPGNDVTDPSSILIEAHLDSRCAELCDVLCQAEGMEDNASGVALVMELARVMSKYAFDHTIVFVATTGEEQGLVGAEAMAFYASQ